MSLSLVQDYSSSEEDTEAPGGESDDSSQDEADSSPSKTAISRINSQVLKSPKASILPSPDDLFLEVTGPPEFLRGTSNDPNIRPPDIRQPALGVPFTSTYKSYPVFVQGDSKDGTGDTKDGAHQAADDTAVVPRAAVFVEKNSTTETDKRNRSKIKDKERSKRMKGQSSHATWKTETEMHLRQQFD